MRALVISGAGRYALLDHDLPPAGPGDLLLAPLAVGLCATDLELLKGSPGGRPGAAAAGSP